MATATQKEQASQYKPGERVRYLAGKGQAEHVGEVVSIGPDGVIRVKNAADMLVSVRPDRVVKENPAEPSTIEADIEAVKAEKPYAQVIAVPTEQIAGIPATAAEPAPPAELKAITIVQPYASLIALPESHPGHKRVENRTWETAHRGLIAIHSSKADSYNGRPCADIAKEYGYDGPLPLGDIVAVAELVDCIDTRTSGTLAFEKHGLAGHRHIEGPVCFVLKNVRALPEPIPCRGAQQIWTVPEGTAAKAFAALSPIACDPMEYFAETVVKVDDAPAEKPKEEPAKAAEPKATDLYVPSVMQWAAVVEAEGEVEQTAASVEEAKEELKIAKDEHDKAVDRLRRAILDAKHPNLFTQRVAPSTPAEVAKVQADAAPKKADEPAPANDAWRSLPVTAIGHGIDEKLAKLLAENEIVTFGQLEDWRGRRYEKPKVKGFGSKKMELVEDAVVAYWMQNPRPSPATSAPKVDGLQWEKDAEGWYAANTAGLTVPGDDGPIPAGFFLDPTDDGKWTIDAGAGLVDDLEPLPKNLPFDDAKAWCEQRNAELATKAAAAAVPPTAALTWRSMPNDDFRIYADNTAGIYGDNTNDDGSLMLATFRIERVAEDKYQIDVSDDVLMPVDFPDSFPSEDTAKTWCEQRNALLAAERANRARRLHRTRPLRPIVRPAADGGSAGREVPSRVRLHGARTVRPGV